MVQEENSLSKLTIKQLIAEMRVSQFWAVLGVVAGLLAGSFVLGHYVGAFRADVNNREYEQCVKRQKDIELQHKFFDAYLRYEIAKDLFEGDSSSEHRENLMASKKIFVDLISDWWSRRGNVEVGVELGKGSDYDDGSAEFHSDRSIWHIPREIKSEVHAKD